MQEDTEWKDALIKHGIIKPDPKPVEEEVEPEPEVIKFNNSDDEEAWLDEKDDDEFIRNYREQRLAEIKLTQLKARFGEVLEITAVDYVKEVNQAGEDIYVVLLLYRQAYVWLQMNKQTFNLRIALQASDEWADAKHLHRAGRQVQGNKVFEKHFNLVHTELSR